jgi:uncharacterized protein
MKITGVRGAAAVALLSGIPIFTLQLSRREAMPSVVHFEITADDLERAIKFYTDIFGWRIRKQHGEESYWLIESNPELKQGITGALVQRSFPEDSTILTFDVASIDDCARKIVRAGGKILRPKDSVPGIGYAQYCQDSEGNLFAILQFDESAQ